MPHGAFYEWLLSEYSGIAAHLKRSGIPTKSSRLHALLRGCRDRSVRETVKVYHRRWRTRRVLIFNPQQMANATFVLEGYHFLWYMTSDHRWLRVMRRWEAKHRPIVLWNIPAIRDLGIKDAKTLNSFLESCEKQLLEGSGTVQPIGFLSGLCPTCEGYGVVPEEHDFCTEYIGCQDCMGSGKA